MFRKVLTLAALAGLLASPALAAEKFKFALN